MVLYLLYCVLVGWIDCSCIVVTLTVTVLMQTLYFYCNS